jgi:hypothetical protein
LSFPKKDGQFCPPGCSAFAGAAFNRARNSGTVSARIAEARELRTRNDNAID